MFVLQSVFALQGAHQSVLDEPLITRVQTMPKHAEDWVESHGAGSSELSDAVAEKFDLPQNLDFDNAFC